MMKITGLSHLFKWENLHNWWLTKYFFAPLYIPTYLMTSSLRGHCLIHNGDVMFHHAGIQQKNIISKN